MSDSKDLAHYGVKGMRWGVKKTKVAEASNRVKVKTKAATKAVIAKVNSREFRQGVLNGIQQAKMVRARMAIDQMILQSTPGQAVGREVARQVKVRGGAYLRNG